MKTNKTMQSLVIKEAKNLKKNALKKELNKLNFKKLDADSPSLCVYGQMTGDCESSRANNLIVESCERVYTKPNKIRDLHIGAKLNGVPKIEKRAKYFSPIELFIMQEINKTNGNNERLIKFLKGETKTLRFK